ncbi:MAG: septum formation initiator family protein [Pseudomonadota bacterium]
MSKQQSQTTGPSSGFAFVIVVALLVLASADLLMSSDGLRKTRQLRAVVMDTRAEIDSLQQRNETLAGEVRNLKHGLEAAEERARSELGMIGENESFYQIIEVTNVP